MLEKYLHLYETRSAICMSAFRRAGLRSVRIPMSVVSAGAHAFRCDFLDYAYVYPQTRIHREAFYPKTKVSLLSGMPKDEDDGVIGKLRKLFRPTMHDRESRRTIAGRGPP